MRGSLSRGLLGLRLVRRPNCTTLPKGCLWIPDLQARRLLWIHDTPITMIIMIVLVVIITYYYDL